MSRSDVSPCAAAPPAAVAIRALTTIDEFARCVELQRRVWGWTDLDLMPVRLFVLMQHVGGLVLGAFDGADLVGFVNCVPGIRDGRTFWHSHMMGVLPSHQNRGIATAMKLAQRQRRAGGVPRMPRRGVRGDRVRTARRLRRLRPPAPRLPRGPISRWSVT